MHTVTLYTLMIINNWFIIMVSLTVEGCNKANSKLSMTMSERYTKLSNDCDICAAKFSKVLPL